MWGGFSICKNKMLLVIQYTYLQFLKASVSLKVENTESHPPSESTAMVIFFTVF